MMDKRQVDVLVIGAGSIGVSVAYYLKKHQPELDVVLVDSGTPLSFTSAQSGENYRNWWPHPIMKQFMDRSIELMEEIVASTDNRIELSRKGYVLASRDPSPDAILDNLAETYTTSNSLRFHSGGSAYAESLSGTSSATIDGVDVLQSSELIQSQYPYFDNELRSIIHIRRGGQLNTQQLGSYMLEVYKEHNGKRVTGEVVAIENAGSFKTQVRSAAGTTTIESASVVNAAGPFAQQIAGMIGEELPVTNVLQQKITFEDTRSAIDRNMPFAIDLDSQSIHWTDEEQEALADEPDLQWLLDTMPGSIHCRPEGSSWIKLGWAYNTNAIAATWEPSLDDHYPEIVLRGASRLLPSLKAYYEGFPRSFSHYGGYYTLTEENWPLIGQTGTSGFFVATAMSGFGSMAACATGELLALSVAQKHLPDYATGLSLKRYDNSSLMNEIAALQSRGIL